MAGKKQQERTAYVQEVLDALTTIQRIVPRLAYPERLELAQAIKGIHRAVINEDKAVRVEGFNVRQNGSLSIVDVADQLAESYGLPQAEEAP